jgi:hypothetical protein
MESVIIRERGNGYPSPGAYVPGDDGHLYRVVSVCNICIENDRRKDNYIHADVELVAWAECAECDQFRAIVEVAS